MRSKLYKSRKWMRLKFIHEKWTEQQIAEYCGVSQVTINKWLHEHGLRKK